MNVPPYFNFPLVRVRALKRIVVGGTLKHKLTTLVAPIGYGKTVLMSLAFSELQRAGKQCIWIGLDDRNATFDTIIEQIAVQLKLSQSRAHPTGALLNGNVSAEQQVDDLSRTLRSNPLPLSIFIDNVNCCADPGITNLIDRITFSTAPRIQLILSSTEDLPCNRARAELEGLLIPLGPNDLRFDRDEIGQVFPPELEQKLGNQGMETVLTRTEGWPAAVRMMQIILERSSDITATLSSISGSHRMLAELLNDEILSRLDEDLKIHLLELSLLHRISAELCMEVWPGVGAALVSETLLQRNILIVPLDAEGTWFRFHGLLREFLTAKAASALTPERRNDIYCRAAAWCAKNGLWRDAIDYWLAGEAFDRASEFLDQHAEQAVRDSGQIGKFLEWVDTLFRFGAGITPQSEYWFIWALAFQRKYDLARQHLYSLRERLGTSKPDGMTQDVTKLSRHLSLLQASIDSLTDNVENAKDEALQWLAGAKGRDDPFELCAAHCIVGNAQTSHHRFVDASQALQAAKQAAFNANSAYVDGWVANYSSLILIAEGNYSEAYSDLVPEITRTRSMLEGNAEIAGALALVAAKCAVEMGLDQEARDLLDSGLPNLRTHGFLEVAACGLSAATALWDGVSVSPYNQRSLQEIANAYPPRLSLMLSCFVTKRMIELGRLEDAISEASRIGMWASLPDCGEQLRSEFPQMRDIFTITKAELLLASQNPEPARHLIEEGISRARAERRIAKLVNWLLLKAQLAGDNRNIELANGLVIEAVRLAAKRRIKRPFVVRRKRLAHLLGQIRNEHGSFALEAERLYFAELFESMDLSASDEQEDPSLLFLEPQLLDQLTPRELDLLRLVAVGMSNAQISGRLSISETTVKWHLQNVFGKLNVRNRSAAVAHARLLGLIN